MKHLSTFTIVGIMILTIITLSFQNNFAQTIIDVPQGVGTLNEAVVADTDPNGSIFRLERGGYYILSGTLTANGSATLRLIAEEGNGPKPIIIPTINPDNGNPLRSFFLNGGLEFRNLYISGINDLGNRAAKNNLRVDGVGVRCIIDNCVMQSDVQAHIRMQGGEQKWYITNSTFGPASTVNDPWDGLHLAGRGGSQDTIWVENSTLYLGSNRAFQDYGGIHKNIIFNHCTFAQFGTVYTGNIEVGNAVNVQFTNNLIMDYGIEGYIVADEEVPQGIIALNPVAPDNSLGVTDADRNITISNNVYGWSQEVVDWISSRSEIAPWVFINDTSMAFADQYANMVVENNIEETVTFTNAPDLAPFIAYAKDRLVDNPPGYDNLLPIYQDVNGTASVSEDITTFGPADNDFDFSYSTSAVAYTAAIGKWPVGDLNWFPDVLADWLADPTDVDEVAELPVDFSLEQNYPNPFNPSTTIKYNLPGESKVSLEVFDVLGSKVASLINGKNQHAGSYEVKFDASQLSSGIYFYRLSADNLVLSKKMILLK